MKTDGTDVRPASLPSSARSGFPADLGSSRRTFVYVAPAMSRYFSAFFEKGDASHLCA